MLRISAKAHDARRMIVLDTNVVSELMKPGPAAGVKRWFAGLTEEPVATTAVTLAELKAGIAFLPHGQRRAALMGALNRVVRVGVGLPIIAFGEDAADVYAALARARRQAGLHIDVADMMIAAVCVLADATLATRNVTDFDGTGLRVVDPWSG